MKNPFRSLRKFIFIVFGIVSFGITGYMYFEGYNFRDALYMTVQVVSTVGFNEVRDFHSWGQEFTSVLILMSFGTFAFAITQLSQILLSGNLNEYLKNKKVQKKIDHLQNHVIVCGYGRNGKQSVVTLLAYNQPFVVIEKNKEILAELKENSQLNFVEGDATDDDILLQAGILRAKALLSSLHNDADNIFVVITARQLNPNLVITSRANEDSTEKKLLTAGANSTVMPNRVGGQHLVHKLMNPDIVEFLDNLSVGGQSSTNIEEIKVNELPPHFNAKTIEDLEIRKQTGCNVIGMKTNNKSMIVNPSIDNELHADSILFVLGNKEQIERLKLFCCPPPVKTSK